jgi:hypothetical protein
VRGASSCVSCVGYASQCSCVSCRAFNVVKDIPRRLLSYTDEQLTLYLITPVLFRSTLKTLETECFNVTEAPNVDV